MFNTQKGISQPGKMHNFPAPALLLACNELCSFSSLSPDCLPQQCWEYTSKSFLNAFKSQGGASPISAPSHPRIPSPSGGGARPGWALSSCVLLCPPSPAFEQQHPGLGERENSNNLPKSQRTFLNLPELGPRGGCSAFPNSRAPKVLKHAAGRSDVENASPCFNVPRDHSSPPHLILYCQALL